MAAGATTSDWLTAGPADADIMSCGPRAAWKRNIVEADSDRKRRMVSPMGRRENLAHCFDRTLCDRDRDRDEEEGQR